MDTIIELAEHIGLITLGAVSGIYLFDLYKRSHRK
jgi:hypothetical protein